MSVRLRLKRYGRRHKPTYRVTAMDRRTPRDGWVIEELGSYDPLQADPTRQLVLNNERIEYWLKVGAQPSNTVRSLLKRGGIAVK